MRNLDCSNHQLTSLNFAADAAISGINTSFNNYTVYQRENPDCSILPGAFRIDQATAVTGGSFDAASNTFRFDEGVKLATYTYGVAMTAVSLSMSSVSSAAIPSGIPVERRYRREVPKESTT